MQPTPEMLDALVLISPRRLTHLPRPVPQLMLLLVTVG